METFVCWELHKLGWLRLRWGNRRTGRSFPAGERNSGRSPADDDGNPGVESKLPRVG